MPPDTAPAPLAPVTPTEALAGAVRVQRRVERARFDAWVAMRDEVAVSGGWTLRETATLHLGMSTREVRALDAVADRRRVLPACMAAFRDGTIGWSQLVSIVYATNRTSGQALARIDTAVAAEAQSAAAEGRCADVVLDLADRLVREARELRSVETSEDTAAAASRVILQPHLDGGGVLIGDYPDAIQFDELSAAIDTAAGQPDADRPRAHDRAEALLAIARGSMSGQTDGPSVPPSTVNVVAQISDLTDPSTFGRLLRRGTRGRALFLTALATDTLACDARVLLTIADGARPLAELRLQDAIPQRVRRAVVGRDLGCRFPACDMPAGWSDVHHLQHRADGGDHDPDNLIVLCRRHHTRLHKPRWQTSFDPDTGRLTVTAPNGTTATSLTPDHHHTRQRQVPAPR